MKKILLFFMAAFMAAGVYAEDVTATIDFSAMNYSNGEAITSVDVDDNVAITFDKGTNSNVPKYYTTGTAIRLYGGNTMTLTCSCVIEGVELTFGDGDGTNEITASTGTFISSEIWGGETTSLTLTIGGKTGHRRIKAVSVTYKSDAAHVNAESVSLTDNKGNALGMYTALTVTDKLQLKAVVAPANATNKNVTWEVMQEDDVISLENGLVTALKPGRAAVVATTEDGEFQAATTFIVSEIQDGTIADFLAAKGGTCYLTGIVSNIENTTYGNFTLTDETGSIYVYGCLNAAGESKKFAELGVEEGNKIKVIASEYKLYGETEEAVNVIFVENFGTPTTPEEITYKVELNGYDMTVTPSDENVSYYVEVMDNESYDYLMNNLTDFGLESLEDYFDVTLEDMGAGLEYFQGTTTLNLVDEWFVEDGDDVNGYTLMICAVDENYNRIGDVKVMAFDTLVAINSIKAEKAATYYNLAGKRINNAQKGIVISNNHKMMVK